MGKDLGQSLGTVPALRRIVEKYGPMRNWPEVLTTLPPVGTPPSASCNTCATADDPAPGWVNRAYPNPNPGVSVPLYRAEPCPECRGGQAELLARLWEQSGIDPFEQERCTFASWDGAANPEMLPALSVAQRWAQGEAQPFVLLHSARKGLGKTHLAIAAAGGCIERGERVLYLVVPNFLDSLRRTQRRDSTERLEDARSPAEHVPALVLDDFGAGTQTDWADGELFKVINERYRRGLRTFITSNVPLGNLEDRIRSRLVDTRLSVVVACRGKDYRELRHSEVES